MNGTVGRVMILYQDSILITEGEDAGRKKQMSKKFISGPSGRWTDHWTKASLNI